MKKLPLIVLLGCAPLTGGATFAQTPAFERQIEGVAALPTGLVTPGGDAIVDLLIVYRLVFHEAPTGAWNPNYSTQVLVTAQPSGLTFSTFDEIIIPVPPDPLGCGTTDCSSCGPLHVNGVFNTLLCSWNCTKCDHVLTSHIPNVPIPSSTTQLHIVVQGASGTPPSTSMRLEPFHGRASYWDRVLKSAVATPVPGTPDTYNISVDVELWRQYVGEYDLSFQLLLIDPQDQVVAQAQFPVAGDFVPNLPCQTTFPKGHCIGACPQGGNCTLNFHYPGYALGCSCLQMLSLDAFVGIHLLHAPADYYIRLESLPGESALPHLPPLKTTKQIDVSPAPTCPGDLNGDGATGVPDLLIVLSCWGPVQPGSECGAADLTGDNNVGVPDLLALLAQWGPCPR